MVEQAFGEMELGLGYQKETININIPLPAPALPTQQQLSPFTVNQDGVAPLRL